MTSPHQLGKLLAVSALFFAYSHLAHSQSVHISEIVADNNNSHTDEDGDSPDWIELYNNANTAIDLTGWHLSDDTSDLTQWTFPATSLAAKSYLIVFASDKNRAISDQELHTNFKLSASGESIALTQPDGSTIQDSHTFGAQTEDISFGYPFTGGTTEVLLDAGATCSAHIPTSSSDASGWTELNFIESGWLTGTTGAGYEINTGYESLIGLDLSAMHNVNSSAYVRVPFNVSNSSAITELALKIKYDDAFIAYINGTLVTHSQHAPATPAWNSQALGYNHDSDAKIYETFDLSEHVDELQDGGNILAIHAFNLPSSSSDLLIVPRLEATRAEVIDTNSASLLASPTPGRANTVTGYAGFLDEMNASPQRGFYDSPISVTLTNPSVDAALYYTTDGSEPTTSSTLYTGPVTVSQTTTLRSKAFRTGWSPSATRTDSYIFVNDVASEPKTNDSINGQDLEFGMNADVVASTYYDANNQLVSVQDALKAIPTLSITTAPDNLFDPSIGIYVNATERWERPASLELIYPDGTEGFHINFGLRIRGGWSRNPEFEKHSFRCLFKTAYGAGKLKYPLFGDEGESSFDNIDLRTAQNYSWARYNSAQNTFLRDIAARDSQGATGHPYTRSEYYHLYLNGQYWGLYMTEERPESSFGASYMGGNAEDYDVIKVKSWTEDDPQSIEATDGTLDAYNRLYTKAMAGFTNNADYFSVQGMDANGNADPTHERLVDIENLIDHQLLIYYYAAKDNGITSYHGGNKLNNLYALYNRADPDGFKWLLHDCEHSMEVVTGSLLDRTGPFTDPNFQLAKYFNAQTLHEKLSANAEYRIKFADRVYKLFKNDGAIAVANLETRFDARAAQIDRAIVANAARWGNTSRDRNTWASAAASARAFYSRSGDRADEVIGYLDDDSLIPAILPPSLSHTDGLVDINEMITLSSASGTIYYSTDGTDPRAIGGAISGDIYSGPISITQPTRIMARARSASGEWSALCDGTFWTAEIPLAVTELMYHAPEGNAYDLIELQNISNESVSLKGYKLDDGIEFKFKNSTFPTLLPGEFMLVVGDIDAFNTKYPDHSSALISGEFNGNLSNSGEGLDLEFRGEDLLTFTYSDARNWPQAADGAGHSLVPVDSAIHAQERGSLNYGGNWRASTYTGGSPGAIDPQLAQTVVINEVIAHTDTGDAAPFDSNDAIELYNAGTQPISLDGWSLSDDISNPQQWLIPDGIVIPAGGFVLFDENDFHPDRINGFGLNKAGEEVILSNSVRVVDSIRFKGQENGASYGRYPDGSAHWMTTEPTRDAPNTIPDASLQISELMYHPLTPGTAFEYVIIENVSSSTITLQNSTGTYRIDGDIEFTFPVNTTLSSGEQLWLVAFDPNTDTTQLEQFASTYGINSAQETILGPYEGKLSNQAGRVAIERPQDSDDPLKPLDISWVVVDEIYYADQAPWPSMADGTGFPLVRTGLSTWGARTTDDTDADGLADSWELLHFGSLQQSDLDWDNDQQTNYQEYIADSDPTDPSSRFTATQSAPATLTWPTKPGRVYSVYWTDDLERPFQLIATGITTGTYIDPLHVSYKSGFYCIEAELE